MTTFYLVRHAHCEAADKIIAGWTRGVHLTPEGRRQAAELADYLSGISFEAVYSSPLQRACDTAAEIVKRQGIKVTVSDKWGEIRYGLWTGSAIKDLEADPDWRRYNHFRSGTRIPGGELFVEVQARAVAEADRIRRAYPDGNVLIVSHSDVIKIVLAYYCGIPLDFLTRIEISLASISILELSENSAKVVQVNRRIVNSK